MSNNTLNFIATGIDRPQFDNLQNGLRRELDPQGFLEEEVFQALVQAAWNRRRVAMLMAGLSPDASIDPLSDEGVAWQYDRYSQYESGYERAFLRAVEELRALQNSRRLRRYLDAKEMPVPASPAAKAGKVLRFGPRPSRSRNANRSTALDTIAA